MVERAEPVRRSPKGHRSRIAVWIPTVLGVATLVATVGTWVAPDPFRTDSAPTGGASPSVTSQGGPSISRSTAAGSTASAAPCVGTRGEGVSCASGEAALVVSTAPCSVDQGLRSLGQDPDLRQIDVEARVVPDGRCVLAPGALARDAGATAADVAGLSDGAVARLSQCLTAVAGQVVPCSQPHLFEFVGPWRPYDGLSSSSELCEELARRYTGRTFDSPGESLVFVKLEDGQQRYRCALKSAEPLTISTWRIGGRPLR